MKSVLITGTSTGIGLESALAFGRAGYTPSHYAEPIPVAGVGFARALKDLPPVSYETRIEAGNRSHQMAGLASQTTGQERKR
jgi:hypothetical protein